MIRSIKKKKLFSSWTCLDLNMQLVSVASNSVHKFHEGRLKIDGLYTPYNPCLHRHHLSEHLMAGTRENTAVPPNPDCCQVL